MPTPNYAINNAGKGLTFEDLLLRRRPPLSSSYISIAAAGTVAAFLAVWTHSRTMHTHVLTAMRLLGPKRPDKNLQRSGETIVVIKELHIKKILFFPLSLLK